MSYYHASMLDPGVWRNILLISISVTTIMHTGTGTAYGVNGLDYKVSGMILDYSFIIPSCGCDACTILCVFVILNFTRCNAVFGIDHNANCNFHFCILCVFFFFFVSVVMEEIDTPSQSKPK